MKGLLIQAIFAAVLGMFQFGFNTGVINSPQVSIEKFIADSYEARLGGDGFSSATVTLLFSLAVSACQVGGMMGGLSAGFVADRFGRRSGLWYTQGLSVVGGVLMGVCEMAGSYELLFIGRLLIGLACGLFTGLVPLYITEIAPLRIRGGLGTVNQLAVTIGILSSQALGLDIALGSEQQWPLLLALGGVVPAVIQLVLLPFMPESPKYLILNRNNNTLGRKSLERLRETQEEVEEEFEEMQEESERARTSDRMNIIELLASSRYRLPLFICILMHLSQQLSGMVAIFYYSTKFFIDAGVPDENAQYATLGVGALMVIMTLVTIPLMDRLGRRSLHLTGLAGIVVFSILITVALSLEGDWVGYFVIVATFGFVVSFALGPGSIPWLITGELFTQAPRPAAVAVATVVNWSANLLVALVFPPLAGALIDFTFLPFSVIVLILFVFLYIYLPETKGRTTGEVADMLNNEAAWKGKAYYGSTDTSTTALADVVASNDPSKERKTSEEEKEDIKKA